MDNKHFPILCDDKRCTGCLACVNSCHFGALKMKTNEEGFYRPMLEENKCVKCNLCEKSCPIVTPPTRFDKKDIVTYAGWHKNDDVRYSSTSGGAFTALAEMVLGKGGSVFGAAYSDDLHVVHIEVKTKEELSRLRLSKYAQSYIGETMKVVRSRLEDKKMVLFVGTPCQVAGLKNYLHRDYENLLMVDFFCHGVPSNNLLQAYIKWLEGRHGKINNLVFRDKRKGWYDSLRVVEKANGKKHILRGFEDAYWVTFNNYDSSMQECCYACEVQGFPRVSDVTIADFWRIGQHIPFGHIDDIEKGVSLVAINNPNKLSLIKEIRKNMFLELRTIEESISGNPASIKSSIRPKDRDTIYNDLKVMGFDQLRRKYMVPSRNQLMVKIFREWLPFCIIKHVRLRKQK